MATTSSARVWKCRSLIMVAVMAFAFFGSISCTTSSSNGDSSPEKEYVVTLGRSNFSDFISKHKFIVVEFYAPWCGHCKKLAPEYEKAAKVLNENDPPVILAKVDANEEKNKPLASEYEIKGFPTIKILRDGGSLVQDYRGPRDADGIVAYLKKQRGPASAEIKSADAAAALIDGKKVVIVGVFPEFSGEQFENFTTLAEKLRSDYEFGHTHNAEYLPRGDTSVTGPVIRLFKPFDELFVDFKVFDVDGLLKLVEESSIPTVTLFNKDPNNHPFVIKFFNSPNSKAMLFLNFSSELIDTFKSKYHEVAEQYKGKGVSFLIGDVEASQGAFQYFGLKDDQVPLIIIQTNDGGKYIKPNLEPDHIAPWVKQFEDGSLQPYRKSQPVPVVNNEPVKVVVADSLQDMVFNSRKNVLLEFYAPWCGHCKQLAPILNETAVSFENDSDIIVAEIDATANDIPRETFDVKGYPTLYFISASGKVMRYEGDRTKDSFINFIQKNRDKYTAEQTSVKEEL